MPKAKTIHFMIKSYSKPYTQSLRVKKYYFGLSMEKIFV